MMHHAPISSITTAQSSQQKKRGLVPPDTPKDVPYDDRFPELMELVVEGLGAELDIDLKESDGKKFDKLACIKEALETCACVGYAVSSLLSSSTSPRTSEPKSYLVIEQNALVGELKSECLLMQRLCTELAEDVGLRNQQLAREINELSTRVGALCHPYELCSLIRAHPKNQCHLDQALTTRMSTIYELELFLTNLLTHHKNSKKSPWISLVIFITHFFS